MRKILFTSLLLNLIGLCLLGLVLFKLGGLSNLFYKLKSKHALAKMDHRQNQFTSSQISKGAIIFLGDSITEFGEWSELFPNQNILNRGIASDGITGIKNRLSEIARHEPSIIFLMVGINDLCFHSSKDVSPSYLSLIKTIGDQFPKTKLIVQSILPINNDIYRTATTNEEVDKVNQTIQNYCLDHNLTYIDIASFLKDSQNKLNSNFTADGIHINGIAYNVWRDQLRPWFPMK